MSRLLHLDGLCPPLKVPDPYQKFSYPHLGPIPPLLHNSSETDKKVRSAISQTVTGAKSQSQHIITAIIRLVTSKNRPYNPL